MVTLAPTGPLPGVKLVIVGGWFGRTLAVAPPALAVTRSRSPSPSTSARATPYGALPTPGSGMEGALTKAGPG